MSVTVSRGRLIIYVLCVVSIGRSLTYKAIYVIKNKGSGLTKG